MSSSVQGRSRTQAIIMIACGTGLIVVGVAGWLTAGLRPLIGAGYGLIGVGCIGRGLRSLRA